MKQPSRPTTPPSGPPVVPRNDAHGGVARALALRDVLHHIADFAKPEPLKKQLRARRSFAVALCAALLALSAYSLVARPEAIWGPRENAIPAAEREAGVRFSMVLLAQRIEEYRDEQGRYPAALGEQVEGISYALVSDSLFELRASLDGKVFVLRSDESADDFLGNSLGVILGTGR